MVDMVVLVPDTRSPLFCVLKERAEISFILLTTKSVTTAFQGMNWLFDNDAYAQGFSMIPKLKLMFGRLNERCLLMLIRAAVLHMAISWKPSLVPQLY